MPLYDVAAGELIETDDDVLLGEDVLEEAREKRAAGKSLEAIAKGIKGARVYDAPEPRSALPGVAVDVGALVDVMGLEKTAEVTGLPVDVVRQYVAAA